MANDNRLEKEPFLLQDMQNCRRWVDLLSLGGYALSLKTCVKMEGNKIHGRMMDSDELKMRKVEVFMDYEMKPNLKRLFQKSFRIRGSWSSSRRVAYFN